MDLHVKKLHFIEEILAIRNEKLIDKLESLLKKEKQKEDSQRVSVEQYNRELEEANNRIESGEYTSHDDVKKESEKWLR
jgi:D-ribose pyranose/furanose isomerase RbsD